MRSLAQLSHQLYSIYIFVSLFYEFLNEKLKKHKAINIFSFVFRPRFCRARDHRDEEIIQIISDRLIAVEWSYMIYHFASSSNCHQIILIIIINKKKSSQSRSISIRLICKQSRVYHGDNTDFLTSTSACEYIYVYVYLSTFFSIRLFFAAFIICILSWSL